MTEPEPKRGFTGYFIPVEVVVDPHLRATDKLLLAEIVALSQNERRACSASNAHLAKHVGITAGGVANALTRLRALGYIETISFDGRRRLVRAFIATLRQPSSSDELSLHPAMTVNKSLKPKQKRQWEASVDFRDNEMQAEWTAWQEHRRQMGIPLTEIARGREVSQLSKLGKERAIKAIRHSIAQGWRGIYEPKPRSIKGGIPATKEPDEIDKAVERGRQQLQELRDREAKQKGKT